MRKSIIITICAAVLTAAAANTGGAGQKSPAEATISDLAWLAGYWMSDKRGTLAEECWLPPEGGMMLGLHRDALNDGNVFFEYLRIMQTADGIFYYATPRGYDTTKFKLTALVEDANSTQAVFENPEHDFPKLIRYTLSSSGLMAEVEGIEDDQNIVEVWVWQRAEFPRTPEFIPLIDRTSDSHEGARTLTLLLASTLTVMAGAAIAPGLPGMRDHFAGVSGAEFLTKLVLTSPALSIAVFGSLVGWLIDRRGRKIVLLWSIALYAVAGTSGLYLDSPQSVLAGRLLLGAAVAGTMTASTTLIGDYFRGAERNRVVGLQAAAMNLGGVVFVTLGGYLAAWHWRAPFLIYASALFLIPIAATTITEPARPRMGDSGTDGTGLSDVWGLLLFLYTVVFLMQIAFFMIPVQLPFYLGRIGETSPTRVGAAIALMTVCSGSTAVSFKFIASRFDKLSIMGASFALMGIGYVILSTASSFGRVAVSVMVFGLGLGMTFPNFIGWLMSGTPAAIRGRVVGGMMTIGFAGQFLSPIAVHPLISRLDLDGAFLVVGIAMIAGAAAALAAPVVKRISRVG